MRVLMMAVVVFLILYTLLMEQGRSIRPKFSGEKEIDDYSKPPPPPPSTPPLEEEGQGQDQEHQTPPTYHFYDAKPKLSSPPPPSTPPMEEEGQGHDQEHQTPPTYHFYDAKPKSSGPVKSIPNPTCIIPC